MDRAACREDQQARLLSIFCGKNRARAVLITPMSGLGRKLIARNVRALRAAKGMSQEDLAGAAEIDRSYVSLIENERYSMSIDIIEKLADAFGIAIHELLHPDTVAQLDKGQRK